MWAGVCFKPARSAGTNSEAQRSALSRLHKLLPKSNGINFSEVIYEKRCFAALLVLFTASVLSSGESPCAPALPITHIERLCYNLRMNISVAGIAVQDGKLFVARRKAGGSMGEKWEFPGGKIENSESCEEALAREFMEEFGVGISVGKQFAESEFENKGQVRQLKAFKINFLSSDFKLCEHTDWRWASCDEIETMDFTPSDLKLLDGIKRHLEAVK
jgi:8-oxo-dGTP diphosphatase